MIRDVTLGLMIAVLVWMSFGLWVWLYAVPIMIHGGQQ